MEKRLNLIPKVVCPGNSRRFGLKVSGRRNALGAVLVRRRCPWFSGTHPAKAAFIRSNTHVLPIYRIPLTAKTHDPDCKAGCLDNPTLIKAMVACAQKAQRNTTGHFTGYIHKRQPVGKLEKAQAAHNLHFFSKHHLPSIQQSAIPSCHQSSTGRSRIPWTLPTCDRGVQLSRQQPSR